MTESLPKSDFISTLTYRAEKKSDFGKRITPAEMFRKNQRAIEQGNAKFGQGKSKNGATRKKIIPDIKKLAKDGFKYFAIIFTASYND